LQILDFDKGKEVFEWNVVDPLLSAFDLDVLQGLLQNRFGVYQLEFGYLDDVFRVGVVFVAEFLAVVFSHARVNASFGFVLHPFADEDFVFFGLKETALAFLHVVDLVAFVMVSVAASEHALAGPFAVLPLALVYVAIGVDHAALPVHDVFEPVAVVARPVLHPQGAFARTHVLLLLAHLLLEQLRLDLAVERTEPVFLVFLEVALLLVA